MTKPLRQGQRLLHRGYVPALALLVAGPVSWFDIKARLGWGRLTIQRLLHVLHAQGLTYIHGYGMAGADRRSRCPIYAFGSQPDATASSPPRPRRDTRPAPIEMLAFCQAIKALMAEALHGQGLSAEVGITPRTALQLLRALKAAKLVHIADYHRRSVSGAGAAMYAWGPGKSDRRKPAPQPRPDLWAKHNAIRTQRNQQAKLLRLMVHGSERRAPVANAS